MPATRALTIYLGELDQPVITDYQIAIFLYRAYRDRKYKDISVKSTVSSLSKEILKKKIVQMCATGILTIHPNFTGNRVYSIMGKKGFDAGDIACAVDPFAYVSHLSAMAYHGLTNRIPSTLYISSPKSTLWRDFANQRMEKDLGNDLQDYLEHRLPKITRVAMTKIGKIPVSLHSSIHLGAFKLVRGRSIRVSTIGRTFLDMVRAPSICGGMRHCMEVYKEHGSMYKPLIIDELNQHGTQIEKSRVGYLMEEVVGVNDDPSLEVWAKHVQRGGSRKLDPSNEYEPVYSERWCISINVPDLGATHE